MAQKNDEKILELKKQIENKRQILKKQNVLYSPITNCLLVLDKVTYNLCVENLELMLIKVNMMVIAAKDAGIDTSKFIISGFTVGIKSKNGAYIEGIKQSFIFIIISLILSLTLKNTKINLIFYYLLLTIVITSSSIIGINIKKKN